MGDALATGVRWAGVALVAILLAPLAAAGAPLARADLLAQGTVSLPGASAASGTPYVLYARESAGLGALVIHATNATIHFHEEHNKRTSMNENVPTLLVNVPPMNQEETWSAKRVDLTLLQGGAGWLGVHARAGSRFAKTGGLSFDVSTASPERVGNGHGLTEKPGGDPDRPLFDADVPSAHLDVVAQDVLFEGPGLVKLMGPEVRLVDDQGERDVATGTFVQGDETHVDDYTQRWLSLEADDITFEAAGAEFLVATGALRANATGDVRLDAAQGEVATLDQVFRAEGGPVFLAGAFDATLVPSSFAGVPTMRVGLDGTLESTSLAATPTGAPRASLGLAWLFPLGLGAALGSGGLVVAGVVRRVQQTRWGDPEDCLALAEAEADARRFDSALVWIRRARAKSPTSQRLLLQEAYLLALRGSPAQALALLDAHPEHARTPEGALVAARILIMGGEPARAGEVLADALRDAPILLVEIEGDATFLSVKGDDRLRRAMQRARSWLDREE